LRLSWSFAFGDLHLACHLTNSKYPLNINPMANDKTLNDMDVEEAERVFDPFPSLEGLE